MNDRAGVDAARALLSRAIESRLAPAAVAELGDSSGMLWREAFGRLTFDAAEPEKYARSFPVNSLAD